jgi:STAS domain
MHAVDSPDQSHPRYRYVIDCGGAQLFIYARSLATVLRVDGEIDGFNAARIATEIRRFSEVGTPLILDLSHLEFLGIDGFQELLALNYDHHTAGLHCSIVKGVAMRPLLRIVTDHGLPLVKSVPEALQLIDDALAGRRQSLQRLVR